MQSSDMYAVAEFVNYDSQLSWKTLRAYARAIHDFTSSPPTTLPTSSFARVSAMDMTDLPRPQSFAAADGVRLGFRHYSAPSSRRVLLLIHGSGGFGDQFHEMGHRLAQRDVAHVYTLDMRGHGNSGGRRGHAVSNPGQMVADVAGFVKQLSSQHPDSQIVLGGHSAGGGVVLAFSRSPAAHLVSAYVFLAPYLGLGSPVNRPHFGGWVKLRGLQLRALTLANVLHVKGYNEATVVDFNMDACSGDPRYVANWSFNTLLAFGPGRWMNRAKPIPAEKPVLVLAGRGDECFVQSLYPEAFQTVAPQAEIPDVGPGGHWDLLVEGAAISELGDWLRRQA